MLTFMSWTSDGENWHTVELSAKPVMCRCSPPDEHPEWPLSGTITITFEPKPQADPELVIEAIEYTYHARCRRV